MCIFVQQKININARLNPSMAGKMFCYLYSWTCVLRIMEAFLTFFLEFLSVNESPAGLTYIISSVRCERG